MKGHEMDADDRLLLVESELLQLAAFVDFVSRLGAAQRAM